METNRTRAPGPQPKASRAARRLAGVLLLAAVAALAVAPSASAGPGYWGKTMVMYQINVADCHTSLDNECSPDCPVTILDGVVCMATKYPQMLYEDSIGDWPLGN